MEITCACGARLRVPDTAAGDAVACPKCRGRIEIPTGIELDIDTRPKPPPVGPPQVSPRERLERVLTTQASQPAPQAYPVLLLQTLWAPGRAFERMSWQLTRPGTWIPILLLFGVGAGVQGGVFLARMEGVANPLAAWVLLSGAAFVLLAVVATVQAVVLLKIAQWIGGGGGFVPILLCVLHISGLTSTVEGVTIPLAGAPAFMLVARLFFWFWPLALLVGATKAVCDMEGMMAFAAVIFTYLAMRVLTLVIVVSLSNAVGGIG